MTQTREQIRTVAAKQARSSKRIIVRNGASKVEFVGGPDETEVPVSKKRFVRIAGRRRQLGKILAGYADTVAEAARVGRSVDVTFRVSPDGNAEPVVTASKVDALDVALAAARVRGQAKVADILRSEDMLTARDFGSLIGASHETVNAKRKRFEVLGLEGATRGVKYPRWQVTDVGLPLPGLSRLFAALGEQPWTVYRFLRTAHADLGGCTALDALKAGQVDAVVGIARNQVTGLFA